MWHPVILEVGSDTDLPSVVKHEFDVNNSFVELFDLVTGSTSQAAPGYDVTVTVNQGQTEVVDDGKLAFYASDQLFSNLANATSMRMVCERAQETQPDTYAISLTGAQGTLSNVCGMDQTFPQDWPSSNNGPDYQNNAVFGPFEMITVDSQGQRTGSKQVWIEFQLAGNYVDAIAWWCQENPGGGVFLDVGTTPAAARMNQGNNPGGNDWYTLSDSLSAP